MPISVRIMPIAPPLRSTTNRLVVALAYDGLCTFEFATAVEVFGLARPEMGPDWYRFAVASLEPGPLRAVGSFHVLVDGGWDLIQEAGTLIVPGWRDIQAPIPDELCDMLRRAHGLGIRIVAICSGVFPVAAAGLLDGRRATTHWRYADTLRERHPAIEVEPDVIYLDEGDVLTSAGGAAGLDLCLHVIRRDFGPEAANKVARRLIVQPHREGGQAQFVDRPILPAREGARLGPLLDRLRTCLDEEHSVASLAEASGMSVRTFLRRFKGATGLAPGAWLVAERISRARELLEATSTTIELVAMQSGFGSTATLRHHFRERVGISPAAYRARFARVGVTAAGP